MGHPKRIWLEKLIVGFAIALTLTACRQSNQTTSAISSPATQNCRTIVHDAGETSICGQPQTIVTLGPNLLELLLVLEVQPIGHAEYFPFPIPVFDQPAQQIPYLGKRLTTEPRNVGTAHNPDLEVITQLKPDLILGDTFKNQDEYALLSQIAPTLLFTYDESTNQSQASWQSDLQAIAQALNLSDQAKTIITSFQERQTNLKHAIAPQAAQTPKLLLLLGQSLEQEIQLESRHSACGSLLEDIGFQVVEPKALTKSSDASHKISLEAIPPLNPDIILIESFNSDIDINTKDPVEQQLKLLKHQWQTNEIAQSLPASQKGEVYFTTVYLCHALLGPIGTEIFLEQLHQQLSETRANKKSVSSE